MLEMRKPDHGSWWGGGLWINHNDSAADTTGLFGLGKREQQHAEAENNHRFAFGLGGANHVAHEARKAQDKALAKRGWFSTDKQSDRYIGLFNSSSGWKKVSGKKGVFAPGNKKGNVTKRGGWFS